MSAPRFAVIIPACNEEAALPLVLKQLRDVLDPKDFIVVVGANGCRDGTVSVAREVGVLVGETTNRGYGFGCQAAIDVVRQTCPTVEAYLFLAADGANDPADIPKLLDAYGQDFLLVLGQRTRHPANRKIMNLPHIIANRMLGAWCGLLTGRFYYDLGPLRLIARSVFEKMEMREWTYGWTIEAQILAARMKFSVREIDVEEHLRVAGEQKVSGVNWRRTFQVGCSIFAAGWRTRFRPLPHLRRDGDYLVNAKEAVQYPVKLGNERG